jgi:topoisomerase-4 subunit A
VTVILSRNGWVRARQGHGIDPATISYKTGDFPMLMAEARTTWPLVIVDTKGRAYSVRVSDLPGGRGDGVPITTMVDFQDGAKLACAVTDVPEAAYLFANSGGYGFVAKVADLVTRQKAGKAFMALEAGERVLAPAKVAGAAVACVSEGARMLVFGLEEVKVQSGGRGVILMGLDPKEALVAVATGSGERWTVEGVGVRGGKARQIVIAGSDLAKYRLHRARKGCLLPEKLKPSSIA